MARVGETAADRNPRLPFVLRSVLIALLILLADFVGLRLDFRQPFVGYGIGGAFLVFIAARPKRTQLGCVFLASLMIGFFVFHSRIEDVSNLTVEVVGSLGLASLLTLFCKLVWQPWSDRKPTMRVLLPASVLTFMVFASVYSLNMASYLHAKTLDLYTFVFDGSLGGEPSFLCGRLLAEHAWLFPAVKITYEGILFAMAAFYAAYLPRRDKPVWELIELLFAAAMIGYLFFSVFPVSGPRYAFPGDYPFTNLSHERLRSLNLRPIAVDWLVPRNGVPSLHFTWALLIWWNARSLNRWARTAALLFVLATVFDTLATGEHYLFDLIAALPFSLWMQASMIRTVGFRDRRRWLPALSGASMFLGLLAIGRFGLSFLLENQGMALALAILVGSSTLVWAFHLPALIVEMEGSADAVASLPNPKAAAAHA
jgi:PAP2 superfamily